MNTSRGVGTFISDGHTPYHGGEERHTRRENGQCRPVRHTTDDDCFARRGRAIISTGYATFMSAMIPNTFVHHYDILVTRHAMLPLSRQDH